MIGFSSKINNKRKGIVIVVVLATVFVLAILVLSYNYFVRGKFNESREILNHIRATKYAQATFNYIVARLENDIQNTSYDEGSMGAILREKVFSYNDPADLNEKIEKEWYDHINCDDFVRKLVEGTIADQEYGCYVDFVFSDIKLLKDLKKANNIDDNIFFWDFEKVGLLTIKVNFSIGHSREVWQETRPFKVVFPFPVPLTKFSFYWKNGVSNPYELNNVTINGDKGEAKDQHPFLIDNGSFYGNEREDVWKDRGWIYVGGGKLLLNRACGDRLYGQRFYSYPRFGPPITLMASGYAGGDGWEERPYKNEILGFRVALWGFSEALIDSTKNQMWSNILKSEYADYPVNMKEYENHWKSSCLHLFSDIKAGNKSENIVPTITRVVGPVYDRFIELGYLLPKNSSNVLFAAVVNYNKKEDYEQSVRKDDSDSEVEGIADFTFENFLFFPNGFKDGYDEGKILQDYFDTFISYKNTSNAISYREVMSKIKEDQTIDVTYDVISQYSSNSEISLPPQSAVPRISDTTFWPNNFDSSDSEILKSDSIKKMDITSIGNTEDTTFGLSLRKCYKIRGSSENVQSQLNTLFNKNIHLNEVNQWSLNNLVVEVDSDNESDSVNIGSSLNIKSPGAIFRKEGALEVGYFNQTEDSEEAPLVLLTGKGPININNASNREIRAYLIALGEDGTIKANADNSPLQIRGGIAVNNFVPNNLPKKGGYLAYNLSLDPTQKSFRQYMGIVLGPRGGGI